MARAIYWAALQRVDRGERVLYLLHAIAPNLAGHSSLQTNIEAPFRIDNERTSWPTLSLERCASKGRWFSTRHLARILYNHPVYHSLHPCILRILQSLSVVSLFPKGFAVADPFCSESCSPLRAATITITLTNAMRFMPGFSLPPRAWKEQIPIV